MRYYRGISATAGTTMQRYLLVILLGLSACASAPNPDSISARAASWQGADVSELAAVLGQPTTIRSDAWIWGFLAPNAYNPPGSGSHGRGSSQGSLSVLRGCPNCAPSHQATGNRGAMPGQVTLTSGSSAAGHGGEHAPANLHDEVIINSSNTESTAVTRLVCKYIAKVEDGVITKLSTLSPPGSHCHFKNLTFRPGVAASAD